MMNIQFYKMHGASNDFILVDDRHCTFPVHDSSWISSISARRTGVGCEGVILIQPSSASNFKMRFFNPDGSEVEMCGNGARCVARLAADIGAAPSNMTIETIAGELRAIVEADSVTLFMTEPKGWSLNQTLEIGGSELTCSSINTGVPHAVVITDNLAGIDVKNAGAGIRYHRSFQPAGTNANFVQIKGPSLIAVRTYERGVEDETLACGTGITAAALIAARLGLVSQPVTVIPASGDSLSVDFMLTDSGANSVTLTGPAQHVFQGTLDYNQ